jgi:xanthosine utilization system XapX-like protein
MPPLPSRHPGIRIDKISPEGEVMGLVFAIGVMAMILISLPSARVFFALSFPTGIILGLILYLIHRRPPRRERIISLHLRDVPDHQAVQPRKVTHPRTPPASGIRMEKISRVGEMGLVFTIGAMAAMAMILISLPVAHEFFAWSFPAGIILGLVLYLIHRRPPRRETIMSLHLRDVPDHRAV